MTYDDALSNLEAMRSTGDDWDGLGSPAPKPEIIDASVRLLRRLDAEGWPAPTRIAASPAGTVAFEWQSPGELEEAEIVSVTEVDWMLVVGGTEFSHWTNTIPDHLDPATFGWTRRGAKVREAVRLFGESVEGGY